MSEAALAREVQEKRSVLAGPDAHLVAWLLLAVVNQIAIATLKLPKEGVGVRLLHMLYDAGHLLALGLLSRIVALLWERFVWRRRWARAVVGYSALTAASIGIGALTLSEDLNGFAQRMAGKHSPTLVLQALVVAVSLGVPIAALTGRLLARRWLRWVGVTVAIAAGVVNQVILRNDYRGAHLYLAWCAAILLGQSLSGVRWLSIAPKPPVRLTALGLAALLAAFSLTIWPKSTVVGQLFRVNGSIVVPWLAQLRSDDDASANAVVPDRSKEWFENRKSAKPIPPSTPSLLPQHPIVVLITIDAMRPELLTDEKYRSRLPMMSRLLEESVHFTNVRAPGTTTRNTLASLFTSKYRSQLDWKFDRNRGHNLVDDKSARFSEIIGKAKLHTFMSVSYPRLVNRIGLVRGFADEVMVKSAVKGQKFALSDALTEKALDRLKVYEGESGGIFIYMHWMDAHDPYNAAGTKGSAFDRYVDEVALCDRSLETLWSFLEQKGWIDRTVLVVSADHGEGFGQHDTPHHGLTIYEELVRVPLMIRIPSKVQRRIDDPISLLDIGPTLLDLLGLKTPGAFMGQSLVPYLRGENPELTRPIVADTGTKRSIIIDKYKVIQDNDRSTLEIYDLEQDPNETENLYDGLGDEGIRMMNVLRTFFNAHAISKSKKLMNVDR